MRIGERLDQIAYILRRVNGDQSPQPAPWRRPGVLGGDELAELRERAAAPVRSWLEAERAQRAALRAAAKQQQQQGGEVT